MNQFRNKRPTKRSRAWSNPRDVSRPSGNCRNQRRSKNGRNIYNNINNNINITFTGKVSGNIFLDSIRSAVRNNDYNLERKNIDNEQNEILKKSDCIRQSDDHGDKSINKRSAGITGVVIKKEDYSIPRMIPVSSSSSSTAGFKRGKSGGVDSDNDDHGDNSSNKRSADITGYSIPRMIPVSSSSSTVGFKRGKSGDVDSDNDDDKNLDSKKKCRRTTDGNLSCKDSRDDNILLVDRTMNQHQQHNCVDHDNNEYDSSDDEAVECVMNQRIKIENNDEDVDLTTTNDERRRRYIARMIVLET